MNYLWYGRTYGSGSMGSKRSVFADIVPRDVPTLEIAPWHNPFLTGPNVKTFDVLDTEALRARARKLGVSEKRIGHIDYVSPIGDLSIISERFDVVYSSHCAEHTPDIIRHFNQVFDILNDGGHYYLFLPDKRFCFDHFLPETSIADVLRAYVEKHTFHSSRSLLHANLLLTHNEPRRHWAGDHGKPRYYTEELQLKDILEQIDDSKGTYVDCHAWQFTPEGFRMIFNYMADNGYCKLRPMRVFGTRVNSHEFAVVLEKVEQ
ncbi:class I SAM-dependent methyltransferase [Yoonia sp. SDW83-1]|uniref:class I SAM-dependent methyltransferase n=1 Tax=Yoonia sp. SDW83-1 TaxID=3366945 RepID=UPI00398C3F3C